MFVAKPVAAEQPGQLSEVREDVDDWDFFLNVRDNHAVDDLHVHVHQATRLCGNVEAFYMILNLQGRTLLEQSHIIVLLLRRNIDCILRATHVAQKRLRLSCSLCLMLLTNHPETCCCEELVVKIP